MRWRLLTMACLLTAVYPLPARAQTIADLERRLLPFQEGEIRNAPGVDGSLWDSLAALRAEEERLRAIKGTITFGLTGDEAGKRSLFKLNTGIGLARGTYPSEISVDSFLGLQLADGKVQEDVTSLKISYDYHATRTFEYFAFAERFSDNYLSIQQRYEVGFGGRIGFDAGRVGNWRETDRQFATLRREIAALRVAAPSFSANGQTRLRTAGVLDEGRYDQSIDNLEKTVADSQSRLFIGLAASVFAELEHAALDVTSTPIAGGPGATAVKTKIALDGTQRYRLNLRPTIRVRPTSDVQIRVFPYWKLPLDGPTHVTMADGTRRLDYRRDVLSEMTWRIRPGATGLESVDFVFTLNHFFDNVPPTLPASLVAAALADGERLEGVTAERAHRFISMALRVTW